MWANGLGLNGRKAKLGAAVYQWCEFKSRRLRREQKFDTQRSNSNTVWFNSELRREIRKRDRLRKLARRSNSDSNINKYKKY
jgi:hypothetical protein